MPSTGQSWPAAASKKVVLAPERDSVRGPCHRCSRHVQWRQRASELPEAAVLLPTLCSRHRYNSQPAISADTERAAVPVRRRRHCCIRTSPGCACGGSCAALQPWHRRQWRGPWGGALSGGRASTAIRPRTQTPVTWASEHGQWVVTYARSAIENGTTASPNESCWLWFWQFATSEPLPLRKMVPAAHRWCFTYLAAELLRAGGAAGSVARDAPGLWLQNQPPSWPPARHRRRPVPAAS